MEEPPIKAGSGRTSASELEGRWRVERLSGMLPPMPGVSKEIREERGRTRFGLLLSLPFRLERSGDRVALIYFPPFSFLVDELKAGSGDSRVGRAMLGGYGLGWFRMVRVR